MAIDFGSKEQVKLAATEGEKRLALYPAFREFVEEIAFQMIPCGNADRILVNKAQELIRKDLNFQLSDIRNPDISIR